MKYLFLLFMLFGLFSCHEIEFLEHQDVRIARDEWGVPHIHGKTDIDVVYGLAWAQCEDDFITLQEQLLAAKGMLGEVKGKDGLVVDFAIKFMGLREEVEARYDIEIRGQHKDLLNSFVDGINAFAKRYPEEVLLDDAFPITNHDLLVAYQLGLVDISGAGNDLRNILEGNIDQEEKLPVGSNAIAISRKKTDGDKTFLAINSHQPLEGWYSWYEAHLSSNEGLNILGGTFPGGFMIFHGVNEYLGWAHTVNHPDLSDVYKLRMHESKPQHYYYGDTILQLERRTYHAWMKLWGPLKIPITRTIYHSIHGPVIKTDQGYFAWRFVASRNLRMSEQWWAMNKAKNFDEFQQALKMQAIPSTNIVYADRYDSIYFISNASVPVRDYGLKWSSTLSGDSPSSLWEEQYYPLDSLPQVLNPESGYVFNTNNSPYNASHADDDPLETDLNDVMGFQGDTLYNNRSRQFLNLIEQYSELSYLDFKDIKFSTTYPDTLTSPTMVNLELLLSLNPDKYQEISDAISLLNKWDRNTNIDNTTAALFIISLKRLTALLASEGKINRGGLITEEDCVKAISQAKDEMMDNYGQIDKALGEIQRHIRGEISLPLSGGPDVLAAIHTQSLDNGIYKGVAGESYIILAQFDSSGVQIETINAYGTSAEPNSPHFTDQMERYVNRQLKPMSLDIDKVFEKADTVYHPLRIINRPM
ncbi:MAG: acylase [Saprospiraceae bacterium]|nr:acylase [Saprospiraceae bacterium]